MADSRGPHSRPTASRVGAWGLDRSRPGPDDGLIEAETAVAPHHGQDTIHRGSMPWGIMFATALAIILLIGGGAFLFRRPLADMLGVPASTTVDGEVQGGGLIEEQLFATVLNAGYSREISDKILSVRRQVEAIRQRNEAADPAIAQQLADVESRIEQSEGERRAAFRTYLRSVDRMGKQPAGEVDEALLSLGKRLDRDKLMRLKALLPLLEKQIGDARAGKIDHDAWISQIEVAPI